MSGMSRLYTSDGMGKFTCQVLDSWPIPFTHRVLTLYWIDSGFAFDATKGGDMPPMHATAPSKDRLSKPNLWLIKNRDTGSISYVKSVLDVLETFEALELREHVLEKMKETRKINLVLSTSTVLKNDRIVDTSRPLPWRKPS